MIRQPSLFDGVTYSTEWDYERLDSLQGRVAAVMSDGEWRTLAEIQAISGGSETGVSARIRDMRKEKCGRQKIESRRRGDETDGLWEYRWTRKGQAA